jgi:uncharacterized protein with PIN domain
VAEYFLDTSALAKLYRNELGSDLLDRIAAEADSRRFISRFTILEMESVLALKFRTGEIDEQSWTLARRRLEADLGSRRLLVASVSDEHLREPVNCSLSTDAPRRFAVLMRCSYPSPWG